MAWLAWLREGETFGIRWADLFATLPGDGESQGLPAAGGALLVKLLQQTKTNRSSVADVALAFCTGSGLNLGQWLLRIRKHTLRAPISDNPTEWATDTRYLFCHSSGLSWDSTYFRQTYLIPLLQAQRLEGDPYLREYDGSPGKKMAEAFYFMHCYRRVGILMFLSATCCVNGKPHQRK